jgi:hypothetical protein
MIVCLKCGHQNEDSSQWCSKCHTYLEWTPKSPTKEPASVLSVSLSTTNVTVLPGAEANCKVTIRNGGTIVDKALLHVIGEVSAWSVVEPGELSLMPGQESTAVVTFRPPRSPAVRAGEMTFGVRVQSSVAGSGSINERGGTVTVGAFTDIRALIVPVTSEGLEAAEHTITVQNEGNTATEVSLSVSDPEEILAFTLQPAKHVVEPGGTAVSRLRVWLRQGVSRPGQRFAFQVVAEPVRMTAVVIDGGFRQVPRPEPAPIKPKRRRWIWPAGIASVLALALAGALVISGAGGILVGPQQSPTPTATPTSSETATPPHAQRLEAEEQTVTSNVPPNLVAPQPDCCGTRWSGGKQLFFRATSVGQYVTLSFPVDVTGTYRVDVRMTKAPDYGIYSLELDGQTLVARYDGFFPGTVGVTVSTEIVPLSSRTHLTAGTHNFTVRITGRSGSGYFAGIDYIDLTPV